MLVSFTGAQSTGKTTLLNECKKRYASSFTFVDNITRNVAKSGKQINQAGNDVTQHAIIQSHIVNASIPDAFLDRCILDGLVYTQYLHRLKQVSDTILEFARETYNTLIPKYDYIFYTHPDGVPLVADNTRTVGESGIKFRNDIIELFDYYIVADPRLHQKVVVLKGSVEQRMQQIIDTLE